MKIRICDKCRKEVEHSNKIHVYNYQVRIIGDKKKINKPKRKDYDLCNSCRLKLIDWLEGGK